MDGIPVKISEKYKPRRKFILPGCILNRINSDVKVENYNFNLERTVLEDLAHLKEAKRRHFVKKQQKRDEWLSRTKVKVQPSENDSFPLDINSQIPPQSTMLTPVPISSNCRIEPNRQEGQINLSDFENDTSSPFDNVELKTINEMEELAHVLGGSSIKVTNPVEDAKSHMSGSVNLPNGYTTNHWGTTADAFGYSGVYGHPNTSSVTSGTSVALPQTHISAGQHSYMSSTNDTIYSSTSSPHISHPYSVQHQAVRNDSYGGPNTYLTRYHQQQLNESITNSHIPPNMTQLSHQFTPCSTPTSTTHSYVSSTNNTINISHNPYIPSNSSSASTASHHLPSTSSSLPKESSNVTSPGISISQQQTEIEEATVTRILNDLRRQVLLRKCELQPKPLPSSSDSPKSFKSPVGRQSNNECNSSNPLENLSLQHQEFAKSMAEMGFPLSRVARATHHFGTDEAKVIEFLLQVQSLQEKHYPEEQIEKALLLHNFKEEEAANYLENLNQIMRLGFKEDDVIRALSRSSNNRDKALDILIS